MKQAVPGIEKEPKGICGTRESQGRGRRARTEGGRLFAAPFRCGEDSAFTAGEPKMRPPPAPTARGGLFWGESGYS